MPLQVPLQAPSRAWVGTYGYLEDAELLRLVYPLPTALYLLYVRCLGQNVVPVIETLDSFDAISTKSSYRININAIKNTVLDECCTQ